MTLAELMQGKTPNPAFKGIATTDDMVLAIGLTGSPTNPNQYLVPLDGLTEQSGALAAETKESTYIRKGKVSTKTGTSRAFKLSGDRYSGDAFQDALLAHPLKYGTGATVIKPYVYFNILTGEGEKGMISIAIEDDLSGAAGENASFSATLTSTDLPTAYTYVPAT